MKYKKVFFILCVGTATAKVFLVETEDTKNSHGLAGDYALDPEKGNGELRTFHSFFWEKNRDRLGNGEPNSGDGHDEPNYGDGNDEPNYGDGHDEASKAAENDESGYKPGKSCTDETGAVYKDGEYWTCADGCNKCSCGDGFIASTRAGCVTIPDGGSKSCTDERGAIYEDGDSWTCADGCNSCWCSGGTIGNTLMECVPNDEDLECESDIECHRKGKDFRCSPNTHFCIQSFGDCDDCEQCGAEMSCIVTLVEVLGSSKVCVLTDQNKV